MRPAVSFEHANNVSIAATALVRRIPLITRNAEDFSNIGELQIIDPYEQ
jgi:predicted nucleic acid-binding protein